MEGGGRGGGGGRGSVDAFSILTFLKMLKADLIMEANDC